MINTVTVSCDPTQSWQQQALVELEDALGEPVELWAHCKTNGWIPQTAAVDQATWESLEGYIRQWSPQIEQAMASGETYTVEDNVGQYSFVIPLGNRSAAIATARTENPDLLTKLANVSSRFYQGQEQIVRLQEENDFFLKQVSDDFEELTFLRSMAQRLGLTDSAQSVEQLVADSLPELGKSAHAEELHFVVNDLEQDQLITLGNWLADEIKWPAQDTASVHRLIQRFRTNAQNQPIIKNAFDSTEIGQADFPGVRDFIIVPVGDELPLMGWFVAVNRIREEEDYVMPEWRLNQHEFGSSEATLLSTAAAMITSHSNNISLFQEREQLLVNVVRTLVFAIEAKDHYTCGHSERVALYGKSLAKKMGYDEQACELLYMTGLLHDIGKIAIDDAILKKPDRLTDEEFAEIKRHPDEGWKILQELHQLSYVLPGVLHHHERMDGRGYPDQLQGMEIPLDGRVLAVADAYDAMTSDRAYRNGMPHEKAIRILREGAGTQWDAEAIEAFLAIEDEITEIRENYQPHSKPTRTPTASLAK